MRSAPTGVRALHDSVREPEPLTALQSQSMNDEGANSIQVILFLASPAYGGVAGYLSATRGHLRPYGGLALAAAIVFASFGLAWTVDAVGDDGTIYDFGVGWGVALPFSGLAAAALIAAALYSRGRGRSRRAMLAGAGLLFPLSAWPLIWSVGIFYVFAAWAVCFTLAAKDPPLRRSEPGS